MIGTYLIGMSVKYERGHMKSNGNEGLNRGLNSAGALFSLNLIVIHLFICVV